MTREEAIKWIDDRMCFGRGTFTEHHPPNIDECWKAGMMAIKALKAEPTDTDLISRADAIKAIRKCKFESDMPSYWYRGMEDAQDIIENIPSADAVPHGRLIDADSLISDLEEWKENPNNDDSSVDLVNHFIGIIRSEPSADAVSREQYQRVIDTVANLTEEISSMVKVVRCKDCKYSFYDKDYGSYNCRKHEYVECFDADDYCSWGERND